MPPQSPLKKSGDHPEWESCLDDHNDDDDNNDDNYDDNNDCGAVNDDNGDDDFRDAKTCNFFHKGLHLSMEEAISAHIHCSLKLQQHTSRRTGHMIQ